MCRWCETIEECSGSYSGSIIGALQKIINIDVREEQYLVSTKGDKRNEEQNEDKMDVEEWNTSNEECSTARVCPKDTKLHRLSLQCSTAIANMFHKTCPAYKVCLTKESVFNVFTAFLLTNHNFSSSSTKKGFVSLSSQFVLIMLTNLGNNVSLSNSSDILPLEHHLLKEFFSIYLEDQNWFPRVWEIC